LRSKTRQALFLPETNVEVIVDLWTTFFTHHLTGISISKVVNVVPFQQVTTGTITE
jgi:hypothetical protein